MARTTRSAPPTRLPLRHAIALGLLQGPTELLPVSSSGHTTLIPWLARWDYAQLDPESRKSFEVALHAGAAAALLVDLRRTGSKQKNEGGLRARVREGARARAAPPRSFHQHLCLYVRRPQFRPPARLGLVAISFVPPAVAGYLFEEKIEQRLGTPGTIAAGLIAGAVGMAVADVRGGRGGLGGSGRRKGRGGKARARAERSLADAGLLDGLALGVGQAMALAPGVSRNGATLTAARLRRFNRADSQTLSWEIALPVIVGASALKGARACQRGVPAGGGKALAAGAGASFCSTLLSCRVLGHSRARRRSLLPYAVYRCLLALLVIARLRTAPTADAAQIIEKMQVHP